MPRRFRVGTMDATDTAAFLELVEGRRGHFRLESGHHSSLWLNLDALFADPKRVEPFVTALADTLRPFAVEVVCGPLLGGAFLAQRIAQVLKVEFCFTERVMPQGAEGMYRASYRLPRVFAKRVRGKRVAMVDDVMSAGSALRGTYEGLVKVDAVPVVAGALLVLGSIGADYFAARGLTVQAAARDSFEMWLPEECPLCARGVPPEDMAAQELQN